jgi:hypothetical protein
MSEGTAYHAKALPPGTILREWRLEGVLGSGGFGIVYRGTGVYFNETVAIKEYLPSAISDRTGGLTVAPIDASSEELYAHGLQKFVEEAKILWNLSKPDRHPNIVCVRSLFEIHGTAYMVMDFESGVSLSQMLKDGRKFDEASLTALVRPVAEGLGRAHSAGVFHRDIKPANILVADDGRPVLIDFGSARFDAGQVTSTKVTFYTPPYAALEQYVRTFPQGAWTDIYALGVTLYQCITGEKPPEVLERVHADAETSLASRAIPGFSERFLRAVDASMAIKPQDRPQSVEQWLAMFDGAPARPAPQRPAVNDLTRVATPAQFASLAAAPPQAQPAPAAGPEPAAAPAKKKSARPLVLAGAALALLVAAGAGSVALRPGSAPPAASDAPTPVAATTAAAGPDLRLVDSMAALVEAATAAGRPEPELAALAAANTRIGELKAQIEAASPDARASLVQQMDTVALEAVRAHVAAMSPDAKRLSARVLGDLQYVEAERRASNSPPSPDLALAITDSTEATTKIDTAITAATGTDAAAATTAAAAANHATLSLSGLQTFSSNAFLTAKRQSFAANADAARAAARQIAELAAMPRPGTFASRARKDAHRSLLQVDTSAKARITALEASAALMARANRTAASRMAAEAATALTELRAALQTAQALAATARG